jgi:hypothetical protein
MVIQIDKTATTEGLKNSLERIRKNRAKRKKPNLVEFFGVLPTIGDGLDFQKKVRDEWD